MKQSCRLAQVHYCSIRYFRFLCKFESAKKKSFELTLYGLYNEVLSTAFKHYFVIQGRKSHQLNLYLKNSEPVELKLGTKVDWYFESSIANLEFPKRK